MQQETGAPLPDLLSLPVECIDALRLLRLSARGATQGPSSDPTSEAFGALGSVWKKAKD